MRTSRTIKALLLVLSCLITFFSVINVQAAALSDSEPPMITATSPSDNDDSIVVYINWDGFAKYYVDLAEYQGKIPTLSQIKNEDGVYFTNAYTGIPSITNSMQAAIASGTTSRFTDNHYRYFNKKLNMIIQEQPAQKNEAETLAEAAVRQNLNVISINHFAFHNRGTVSGNPSQAYVIAPNGSNGYSDAIARFDEAIRLIKTLKSGDMSFDQLPRFIALYMDDLDGIGHNRSKNYGVAPVTTEEARKQAVVDRLAIMDGKLGEFIQACKDAGVYDNMSFVLTTDHGMAPFGIQQSETDDSAQTKLTDLIAAIEVLGPGFKCETLHPDGIQTPSEGTDIVVVTVGLQVQLSFVGEFDPVVINIKNKKIAEALNNKNYIGIIMFPDEMVSRGVKSDFADLIISPKPPYHFRLPDSNLATARGQHDSLAEEAQHIASFMWGKGIKKGFTYQDAIYNYDFTSTMAKLLGINAPLDATGKVLYDAIDLDTDTLPWEYSVKFENEDAVGSGTTMQYWNDEASVGTLTSIFGDLTSLEFTNVPTSKKMIIKYATIDNDKLSLYVNNVFVRDIFFPSTSQSGTKNDEKIINLTLYNGDAIKLVNFATRDYANISIDCIIFLCDYKSTFVNSILYNRYKNNR